MINEFDNEINNSENKGGNAMAIAGMVLGIISIVFCWVPVLGTVLAIAGIALGIIGMKKSAELNGKGKGFGIAGLSCGSVGAVLSVIYLIIWIFTAIIVKDAVDYTKNEVNSYKKLYNSYSYNRSIDDFDF